MEDAPSGDCPPQHSLPLPRRGESYRNQLQLAADLCGQPASLVFPPDVERALRKDGTSAVPGSEADGIEASKEAHSPRLVLGLFLVCLWRRGVV